jgi:hypothetical protein
MAVSKGGGAIDTSTDRVLWFDGKAEITLAPGAAMTSDPFPFDLQPRTDIAITIFVGNTSASVTGHPGSRTTSYLLAGNEVARADFAGAVTTDHWYNINAIDVLAPRAIMTGVSILTRRCAIHRIPQDVCHHIKMTVCSLMRQDTE